MITTETGATVALDVDSDTPSGQPYAALTISNGMRSLVVALDRDELQTLMLNAAGVWTALGDAVR
ncbi:hypothetical protein [Nocardia sp. NPDC049707]|uniref:hypothetical protein n=1 Tax=Nocardia sp. NPDC049707 TaxID=3154735 RepID=UPI00343F1C42